MSAFVLPSRRDATPAVLASVDELVATERPEEPMHCLHPA